MLIATVIFFAFLYETESIHSIQSISTSHSSHELQSKSWYQNLMWQPSIASKVWAILSSNKHNGLEKRQKPFPLPQKVPLLFCISPPLPLSVPATINQSDFFFVLLSFLECYRNESCRMPHFVSICLISLCILKSYPYFSSVRSGLVFFLLLSIIPICFEFFKNLVAIQLETVCQRALVLILFQRKLNPWETQGELEGSEYLKSGGLLFWKIMLWSFFSHFF